MVDSLCSFLKNLGHLHWGWWLLIGLAALAFYKKVRSFIQTELPILYPFLESLYLSACEKIQGFAELQQQCFQSKIEARKIFNDLQQTLLEAGNTLRPQQ